MAAWGSMALYLGRLKRLSCASDVCFANDTPLLEASKLPLAPETDKPSRALPWPRPDGERCDAVRAELLLGSLRAVAA